MLLPSAPPAIPYTTRMPDIIFRSQWGANPPVLEMPTHEITHITIHHAGVATNYERPFETMLRNLQSWSQREGDLAGGGTKPQWADIPYHYYISWQGEIAECRPITMPGDTNTTYDPTGHALVCLEGNLDTETFFPAQREAMYRLTAYLQHRYKVPSYRIKGHRDYAETSCPGDKAYRDLPYLRLWIAENN